MKTLFSCSLSFLLFLITIGNQNVFAQETDSVEYGKWAIQFQIGENFSLKPFNGMGLAGMYRITNTSALRVSIRLNSRFGDDESEQENLSIIRDEFYAEQKYEDYGINIITEYLAYHSFINNVSLFYGLGPLFQYSNIDTRSQSIRQTGEQITKSNGRREGFRLSAGLSGVCGVEWFVLKNLSLTGEYNLSTGYERYIFKNTFTDTYDSGEIFERKSESAGSAFTIYSGSVKLGLAIYF